MASNITMLDAQIRLLEATDLVRRFVPSFAVKSKVSAWHQRVLGIFSSKYMSNGWTTVGYTTYYPAKASTYDWATVLHEGVHARQAMALSRPLFIFLYLCPQILSVFFLPLAFISPWFLLGLALLAPIPAWYRYRAEADAHCTQFASIWWYYGDQISEDEFLGWIEHPFSSPLYYFMWPFKGHLRRRFSKFFQSLKDDSIEMTDYLWACRHLAYKYKNLDD